MKRNTCIKILGVILGFLPALVFAQSNASGQGVFNSWANFVAKALNNLFPIVIALGGVFFMYQVIRFLFSQSESERAELRNSIGINIVILVVLLGFWGIIKMVTGMFGLTLGTDIAIAGNATSTCSANTIRGIITCLTKFISQKMIPVAVSFAALTFMWNIVKYLNKTNSEAERTNAKNYILWSLLALGVMLTIFGVLNLGTKTLFGSSAFVPQFPTSKSK